MKKFYVPTVSLEVFRNCNASEVCARTRVERLRRSERCTVLVAVAVSRLIICARPVVTSLGWRPKTTVRGKGVQLRGKHSSMIKILLVLRLSSETKKKKIGGSYIFFNLRFNFNRLFEG